MERTFALIKPDAVGKPWTEEVEEKAEEGPDVKVTKTRAGDKSNEILKRIAAAGFTVVSQRLLQLTHAQAADFYAEHAGKPFYEALVAFMSSAPCIALVLERADAVRVWRELMGPTNTGAAFAASQGAHPLNEEAWTLRALFGTDGTRNAVHGSAHAYAVAREAEFFFPAPEAYQRTLAMIKPDAVSAGRTDAILAQLRDNGFLVVGRKTETLTADRAKAFYAEHVGKPFYADLVKFMTSGPVEALVLERMNAITAWRLLQGPTNTAVAKSDYPGTVRGRFATDGTRNATHGSDSSASADREIAFWFPEGLPIENTLALIKPGTAAAHGHEIRRLMGAYGFSVQAEREVALSREQAEAFYAEHKGKPFYDKLVAYMCSAPLVALVLSKAAAIASWRALIGPTNVEVARRDAPNSIRARFGEDGTRNATHGSDSPVSAAREIAFFFPEFGAQTLLTGKIAAEWIRKRVVATSYAPDGPVERTLHSVLVEGLTALCKAKPAGLDAVTWLGRWLLENNPRRGRVSEPAVDEARAPVLRGALQTADVVETKYADGKRGGEDEAPARGPREQSIVFVLGGPGSGKGTQCARLAKTFGYAHLSTGDLLRDELKSGSALGLTLEATMKAGGLVPLEAVLGLLRAAMKKAGGNRFLIDGYPRELAQAIEFERAIGEPHFVLAFEASETVMMARLVERGKTSGRADDNVASIKKRFETFRAQSQPVIDFYSKLGKVRSVNAERSIEAIYCDAAALFEPDVVFVLGPTGSGRSTACAGIAATFGCLHISTGQLLRDEVIEGTKLGGEIDGMLKAGDLVPLPVIMRVLKAKLDKHPCSRFVIDGFPASVPQALAFERQLGAAKYVVELQCPPDVCAARAGGRGSTDRRGDDAAGAVRHKLKVYEEETRPVVEMYAQCGMVRRVDSSVPREAMLLAARAAVQPTIVFVLGGPGSGKGTQCARIVRDFGFTHLSAGDLLRAEVVRKSPDGAMIDGMIKLGQIVPVEVTLALIRKAMRAAGGGKFLIDGFPRAMDQAEAFERLVGPCAFVLFFDCDEPTMRARLLDRGKTSGRSDDNEAAIVKRFVTFKEQSMPVINHYAKLGRVRKIDAMRSVDAVFDDVKKVFAPEVVFVLGGPGSGKGTQCTRIVRDFGYTHLSAGDLLRGEVARGSKNGDMLQAMMTAGQIVPLDVTVGLLRRALDASGGRRFLIDGFPRAMDQAVYFEKVVGPPAFVLFLECSEETMKKRLLNRGLTSGRADDNEATIVKRFKTFVEQSLPVVEHYRARGLVRTVSTAPAPDEVYSEVRGGFHKHIVVLLGSSGSGRGEFVLRAGRELGYEHVKVTELLAEEAARGSPVGHEIAASLAAHRTAPIGATVTVIAAAMRASTARRFLLDGFPRVVSDGFPSVHDQVYELETRLGGVRAAIALEADMTTRRARIGPAPTIGQEAGLARSLDTYAREKAPVVAFFERAGKARVLDTAKLDPDRLFEETRSLLL